MHSIAADRRLWPSMDTSCRGDQREATIFDHTTITCYGMFRIIICLNIRIIIAFKFVNHLTLPVELYVDSVAKPGEKDCCGRVNPDESYNLPLNYLYSPIGYLLNKHNTYRSQM